jgi:uncharacterized membrane protein YqjE
MAVGERSAVPEGAVGNGGPRGFGDLLSRLAADLRRLLDQKLALLKLELSEELAALARRSVLLVAGGAVAVLGVFLLVIALAIWLGEAMGSLPGGFAVVGVVLALGGGGLALVARRQLSAQRFVPRRTVEELRRDAQWIKHEL